MKVFFSLIMIIIALGLIGCSEEFLTAPDQADQTDVYAKRIKTTELTMDVQSTEVSEYPQMTSVTAGYFRNWGQYKGVICNLENGSFFEVYNGALTPPSSIPWGEEVTITMRADKDPITGELIYSFGPSGCHFEPAAILWLDYSDLGTENATLYYLDEEGNRVEHLPDNIDFYNRRMCIYIDHFSRYAVAYSD
jgi:hypothetical protein